MPRDAMVGRWLLALALATIATSVQAANPTVIEYVIDRLADLGCDKMFGIPGDWAFPINNAVADSKRMKWVGNANELNAGYMADGYARIKGVGCFSDTYGVGEFSSYNAMMGAKADNVVVFHVVGCPSTRLLDQRRVLHHSLGHGNDEFFPIGCASTVACTRLTALNAIDEVERVIVAGLVQRGPVYIQVPTDVAEQTIMGTPPKGLPWNKMQPIKSEPKELKAAVASITKRLRAAKNPVILPSIEISRMKLNDAVLSVVDATGIPFTTTSVDKGVLPETHPKFLGFYRGNFSFPPALKERVEDSDLVLNLGDAVFTDIVVGYGSIKIPKDSMIVVGPSYVRVFQGAGDVDERSILYHPVWMGDILAALKATGKHPVANTANGKKLPLPPGTAERTKQERAQLQNASAPITYEVIQHAMEDVLKPSDILMVECGTMPSRMGKITLPANVSFNGQFVWGSIGWGTPAAAGAKAASPSSRVFLVSGEGAHHMTLNELGFMCFHDINPIILVGNNDWYWAEEELDRNSKRVFNKMPPKYNFSALPAAMGCDKWYTAQVDNPPQLVAALKKAVASRSGAYIEARMLGPVPPALSQDIIDQFYLTKPLEASTITL